MRQSIRYYFILVLLFISCFESCKKQGSDENKQENHATPVVAVRIAPIVIGDAIQTASAVGKIEVIKKEKIFSPVAGKITSLRVLEGSSVNTGDSIVMILTKESQAAISGAEALLRSAVTEQQKEEAEQTLQLARSSKSTVTITAKFNGVVAARNVSEGELISENTELLTVIDPTSLAFLADVPLSEIRRIHTGTFVQLHFQSLPGKEFQATVDAILPQTDAQSQTVRVRIRFAENTSALQSLLRPDMIGIAELVTGIHKHAFLIPKSALLRDDEKNTYSVIVLTTDSLAKSISVEIGVSTDSTVEIINPLLKEGMFVITEGNYALADSTRLTVKPQDMQ